MSLLKSNTKNKLRGAEKGHSPGGAVDKESQKLWNTSPYHDTLPPHPSAQDPF